MATQRKMIGIPVMLVIGATAVSSLLTIPSLAQNKPSATTLESAIEPVWVTEPMMRCDKYIVPPVHAKLSGRRASRNFTLRVRKGERICIRTSRLGIVFNLRKDVPGPNDRIVAANVGTGTYVVRKPNLLERIYISNPQRDGGKGFTVTFKK